MAQQWFFCNNLERWHINLASSLPVLVRGAYYTVLHVHIKPGLTDTATQQLETG